MTVNSLEEVRYYTNTNGQRFKSFIYLDETTPSNTRTMFEGYEQLPDFDPAQDDIADTSRKSETGKISLKKKL